MKKILMVVFSFTLSLSAFVPTVQLNALSSGAAASQIACRNGQQPTVEGCGSATQIAVISPTSGDQWGVGSTNTIQWYALSSVSAVNISLKAYYSCTTGQPNQACVMADPAPISIASNVPNTGSYTWTVPSSLYGQYTVIVSDAGTSGLSGSSGVFTIGTTNVTVGAITVISPNGGETWMKGSSYNVLWTAPNNVSTVTISLGKYYACLSATPRCSIPQIVPVPLAQNVPNTGSYSWTISNDIPSGQYLLQISSSDGSLTGSGKAPFTISSSTTFICEHPAPPAGCNYSADSSNSCGVLVCGSPPTPTPTPPTCTATDACPTLPPVSNATLSYFIHPGVLLKDGPGYYIVTGPNSVAGFSKLSVLRSYGYDPKEAVAARLSDLGLTMTNVANYSDGTLVLDHGTIYELVGNQKHAFSSYRVFKGLGFTLAGVIQSNLSSYVASSPITDTSRHLPGTSLKSGQTVYYVGSNSLYGYPSMNEYQSWRVNTGRIVNATPEDLKLPQQTAGFRDGSLLNKNGSYYLYSQGQTYAFESLDQLKTLGFNPNFIVTVSLPTTPPVCEHPAPPAGYHWVLGRADTCADDQLVPDGSTGSINVTSPQAGQTLARGSAQNITWTPSGSNGTVNILLSLYSPPCTGFTCPAGPDLLPYTIVKGAPDTGSFSWTVGQINPPSGCGAPPYPCDPAPLPNGKYQIIVAPTDHSLSGISGAFNITSSASVGINVTSPKTGQTLVQGTKQNITWTPSGSNGTVNILLSPYFYSPPSCTAFPCNAVDRVQPYTIAKGVADTGSFSWTVGQATRGLDCPANASCGTPPVPDGQYQITVSRPDNATSGISGAFTLAPNNSPPSSGPITVISPAGGEQWANGTTHTITWDTTNLDSSNVSIGVSTPNDEGGGYGFVNNFASVPGNSGSYSWTIGQKTSIAPGVYRIVISGVLACTDSAPGSNIPGSCFGYKGVSNIFSITSGSTSGGPTISSITPTSGPLGTQVTIKGSGFTASGNYVISNGLQLSQGGSSDGTTFSFLLPSGAGYYCPTTSDPPCLSAYVAITLGNYPIIIRNANGDSNSMTFTVTAGGGYAPNTAPFINRISPTSGPVGTQVTLTGLFASSGNTVRFVSLQQGYTVTINNLNSSDGTTLIFTVPSQIQSACQNNNGMYTTQCYPPPVALGDHSIFVDNAGGTSNPKTFTVTQ